MASCRARPRSSSNWRDAPTFAFDLPRFFSAGTANPARIPRIEITTSNSISVKAEDGRRPKVEGRGQNWPSTLDTRPSTFVWTFTTTTFKKRSLPAQDVVLVGCHASPAVGQQINLFVRPGGPNHDLAAICKIIDCNRRIRQRHQTKVAGPMILPRQ